MVPGRHDVIFWLLFWHFLSAKDNAVITQSHIKIISRPKVIIPSHGFYLSEKRLWWTKTLGSEDGLKWARLIRLCVAFNTWDHMVTIFPFVVMYGVNFRYCGVSRTMQNADFGKYLSIGLHVGIGLIFAKIGIKGWARLPISLSVIRITAISLNWISDN